MSMSNTPTISLTNTYGRELEDFVPIDPAIVHVYTCGPTVYNYAHIGNFRAFIFADSLRRMLEYNNFPVTHVRNITDVGHLTDETLNTGIDRIERAARERDMSPWDIAAFFTQAFLRDADMLNLLRPTYMPHATEFIAQMIQLAEVLIAKDYAYVSAGNVYFDVARFRQYGALSGNTVSDLVEEHRVESGEGKRSPADFAVWKATEPDKLMHWPSPWSEGVPGWHLECSAMAMDLLGEQIDIHTGGIDNIFPHHEDEIAQSEAATGCRFARYWMHSAWLQGTDAEKMSKSTGNIFTVEELVSEGIQPLAFRFFTFQAHYRTPLSFSWEALEASQTALIRLWEAAAEFYQAKDDGPVTTEAEELRRQFHAAINRDLDLPSALAVTHGVVGAKISPADKYALLLDFDQVLGLSIEEVAGVLSRVSTDESKLLEQRAESRQNKDWVRSDALRSELLQRGLDVKDTPEGQRWVRKEALEAGAVPGPKNQG